MKDFNEELQTTFNLMREHGCTVVLDTWGLNRIRYRERDDVYLRFSPDAEHPDSGTTCDDEHVAGDIEKHGIRTVIKA